MDRLFLSGRDIKEDISIGVYDQND